MVETIAKPFPKTDSNIGIDLGLTDFIVLSNGTKVANPKFLSKLQNKLARAQKIMSKRALVAKKDKRKLRDSKNYQKQKLKVAKIHEKISNTRKDFLHKQYFYIVKSNDIIVISDRSWSCHSCKAENDRDLNTSVNILSEGLRCLTLKEPLLQGS